MTSVFNLMIRISPVSRAERSFPDLVVWLGKTKYFSE